MIIRRNNSNTLTLESSMDKSGITIKNLDGQLMVVVSDGSKDIEITRPGDYEYFGLGITGFELQKEKFKGIINILKLNVDGVKIVFTADFDEINKDILSSLANIAILAIPSNEASIVKNLVNAVEPKKLVLIKNFGGKDSEIESITKTLGIPSAQEVSSIKNKIGDFPESSDEFILQGEILT